MLSASSSSHAFGANTSKRPCACGYFGCGGGWGGGVGWGGTLTFIATATSTFSCASTHTSCYAAARSLALPHIRHATNNKCQKSA